MNDYKVKLKANVSDGFFGLFDKQFEGIEIVEAGSEKEAIEKVSRMFRVKFDDDEVQITVTDVEKL